MTTITERVTAGAAFLDEHDPGWWREDVERPINLDTLELADGATCILGQRCPLEVLHGHLTGRGVDRPDLDLYASARFAAYAVTICDAAGGYSSDWAAALGFLADFNARGRLRRDEYVDLNSAWWVLINERRKLAADEAVA